jgi:VWFA-related protein
MINKLRLIFLLLLIGLTPIAGLAQDAKSKIWFSVLDGDGNFFDALKSSDIQIRRDKNLLSLVSLQSKAESPLELMIMIDASMSQERMLPVEKKLAEALIDGVLKPEKDKVGVLKLTGEVTVVEELTGDFRRAKEQINEIAVEASKRNFGTIIGGIFTSTPPIVSKDPKVIKASTSLWASIKEVSGAFAKIKSGKNARRAIILISDGVNTFGEAKLTEAIDESIKNQIPVYAIGVGDELYGGVDEGTLKKLTRQTGGLLVMPKNKVENFEKQLKKIEAGLRSVYEATFAPGAASRKNALPELEIKITNGELSKKKLQIIQPKGF